MTDRIANALESLFEAQREANEIARIQIILTLPDTPEALRESASTNVAAKALLERVFKGLGL